MLPKMVSLLAWGRSLSWSQPEVQRGFSTDHRDLREVGDAALRAQRCGSRANEMLYNPCAVQEFGGVDGLREALEVLRQVRGGELGPAMDENVRMLATEIEVKCFHEKLPPSGNGWTSFTKVPRGRDSPG
eukprot:s2096_g10.t1